MAFEEIVPQPLIMWQSDESPKEYEQRISRQHYSLWFLQSIRFHTQKKDGADTTSIWSFQRNSYSYNDAKKTQKNTKARACSPDGNTDFFDIVTEIMQGDTLAPYLFIICLDYERRTSIDLIKENSFTLKKANEDDIP